MSTRNTANPTLSSNSSTMSIFTPANWGQSIKTISERTRSFRTISTNLREDDRAAGRAGSCSMNSGGGVRINRVKSIGEPGFLILISRRIKETLTELAPVLWVKFHDELGCVQSPNRDVPFVKPVNQNNDELRRSDRYRLKCSGRRFSNVVRETRGDGRHS